MKKFLIAFALFVASAQTPEVDELKIKVYNFEKHYDVFFRKLFGCPAEGFLTKENCFPNRGVVDYSSLQKARKEADKLFR